MTNRHRHDAQSNGASTSEASANTPYNPRSMTFVVTGIEPRHRQTFWTPTRIDFEGVGLSTEDELDTRLQWLNSLAPLISRWPTLTGIPIRVTASLAFAQIEAGSAPQAVTELVAVPIFPAGLSAKRLKKVAAATAGFAAIAGSTWKRVAGRCLPEPMVSGYAKRLAQ